MSERTFTIEMIDMDLADLDTDEFLGLTPTYLRSILLELKRCYEEIDWMKGLVKNLYRLLHDADEDMAYAWAVKHVGEEDMWVVRDDASE
tara:strand:+ start:270 stop:539 length:270 start_codon:yes stop_codon:yes gene_type:complete